MKKILYIILIVLVVIVVAGIVWTRFVPVNDIDFISENDNAVSDLVCSYPIRISGDSMFPILDDGETIIFSKCFTSEDVKVGTVLTYKSDTVQRVVVVRNILEDGTYEVSNESNKIELRIITFEDILAIDK